MPFALTCARVLVCTAFLACSGSRSKPEATETTPPTPETSAPAPDTAAPLEVAAPRQLPPDEPFAKRWWESATPCPGGGKLVRDPNREERHEYCQVDGRREGPAAHFDDKGALSSQEHWRADKLDGLQ